MFFKTVSSTYFHDDAQVGTKGDIDPKKFSDLFKDIWKERKLAKEDTFVEVAAECNLNNVQKSMRNL